MSSTPTTSRQITNSRKKLFNPNENDCTTKKITIDLADNRKTSDDDTLSSRRSDTPSTSSSSAAASSVASSILSNFASASSINASTIKIRPCDKGVVYTCDRTSSLNFVRHYSRKLGAAAFAQNLPKYNPRMARKHVQKERTPREQRLRDKNTIDARISRQRKIRNTDAMMYCEREEEKDHEKLQRLKASMIIYLKKLNQELVNDDDTICEENIIEHDDDIEDEDQ